MANSVTRTLILKEITRRGWQSQTFGPNAPFLKITHPDGRWEIITGTNSTRSSAIGDKIAANKDIALDFVESYGYKVPKYELVADVQSAIDFLHRNHRIVIKPTDSSQTKGVTVGLTTEEGVSVAFKYAQSFSKSNNVIAQRHLEGRLYRLVVLNGKLMAAIERQPASVIGNGINTISELMHTINQDPSRGESLHASLSPIDVEAAKDFLGIRIDDIPELNEEVTVVAINMIGNGGLSVSLLDKVHADWREFAEHISTEIKLFMSGIDVICDDISKPLDNNYVPLLEINAAPALRFHEYPTVGKPVHLAALLLDELFPDIDK